jgi:hypothetical protein
VGALGQHALDFLAHPLTIQPPIVAAKIAERGADRPEIPRHGHPLSRTLALHFSHVEAIHFGAQTITLTLHRPQAAAIVRGLP